MRLNVRERHESHTHEGGHAYAHLKPEQALRRSVLACLLWENEFYEDGEKIADRIIGLCNQVPAEVLASLATEARGDFKLRHAPLLLLCGLAKKGGRIVGDAIAGVIQRPDELTELLSIYWRNGKVPLSKQMKLGLARAFAKFDEYQFAKYDRDGAIKLRDVMFLVRPNPSENRADLYRRIADRTLATPDTWEVGLSGGSDKKETFERLLSERKLGYMAVLRNLRNMDQAKVDDALILKALEKPARTILPFRFITAARAVPRFEPALDKALKVLLGDQTRLPGMTAVLVDVSGSMDWGKLSGKSQITRMDAAAGLASIINGQRRVFTFSHDVVEVPPRLGMAGVDSIVTSQVHGGTYLGAAVAHLDNTIDYDRLIVITDEQSHDTVPAPKGRGYMINVASNQNGVGYGPWTHIDGFSEATLRYIAEIETEAA